MLVFDMDAGVSRGSVVVRLKGERDWAYAGEFQGEESVPEDLSVLVE